MTQATRGRPRHPDRLTPAEWRVVEQVRHGLSNPRIADRMGVSVNAVKFSLGNAMAKLGLASRREVQRWDGIALGTALDRRGESMNIDHAAVTLGQVARSTRDVAVSRAWYRDTLGLPELYCFGNLAFFDLGGVRLMLAKGEATGESLLYLRVADIHSRKAVLEQRGIKFTHAPHRVHVHDDGTEEWMAFFLDNEDRPLALMSQIRAV